MKNIRPIRGKSAKSIAPPNPPDPMDFSDGNARLVVVRYTDPDDGIVKLLWQSHSADISLVCDMAHDIQGELRAQERRTLMGSIDRLRESYNKLVERSSGREHA